MTRLSGWWGIALLLAGQIAHAEDLPFRVVAEGLPAVDNLARADDGTLYATLELGQGGGRVIKVAPDGTLSVVLQALDRPDGLLLVGDTLYITEEVRAGRVLAYGLKSGELRQITILRNPEGIDRLPDGSLVVAEDRKQGRIVRIAPDGTVSELAGGLNRPEGLAVAPDGTIYIAETASGRVLALREGKLTPVASDLNEPDQVAIGPFGILFVTEDARPGRLLKSFGNRMIPVLGGLAAPQGMAFRPPTPECGAAIYLAEQGTGRILELGPECPTSPSDE
ncbi:MAG: hypothetical protein OEY97_02180 [Nitrospirota bacterium]|nr:hypothetical protein [Nitrospirota bacterium]